MNDWDTEGVGHKNIIDDQIFYATFHKMWENLTYQASFNEDIANL